MSFPSRTSGNITSPPRPTGDDAFFFEGAGRGQVVEQIYRYLLEQPAIIVLTGPVGSGRSRILKKIHYLVQSDEGDCCLLGDDCMVLETEEELYGVLAKGFGLEEKSLELLEDLAERVQHFLNVGLRAGRMMVIIIDDARQHSADVLAALLQLTSSHPGLSILLSGEDALFTTLQQFHLESLLVHRVALRPLAAEEVGVFARERSRHEGNISEETLGESQVEEWMGKTGGNISLLVKEMQQRKPSAAKSTQKNLTSFPLMHLIAMSVVVILTLTAYFYYPDETTVVEPVATISPVPLSKPAPKPAIPMSRPESVSDHVVVTNPPTSDKNDEKIISAITLPQEAPADIVSPSPEPLHGDYTAEEAELMARPENNIALQILSLSSEQPVIDFKAQQSSADQQQLRYYRRGHGDKVIYVLIYGEYPDKAAAVEAVKSLPASLKKGSPWPRPYADIQRDIRDRQ